MEDPTTTLETAGYTALVEQYVGTDAYSYVFFGQAGYLDHPLASRSMAGQVTGASIWDINADEHRSSDHDPVIVDLELGLERIYLPVVMRRSQ